MNSLTRSVLLILLAALCIAALTLLFHDYHHETEFLIYRFATNLEAGRGLVYNTGDNVLLTFSPALPIILAASPLAPHVTAALLSSVSVFFSGMFLYLMLRRLDLAPEACILAVMTLTLNFPIWASFRSAELISLPLILVAVLYGLGNRWRIAGISMGVAVLLNFQNVLVAVLVGALSLASARGRQYWFALLTLPLVWAAYALNRYDTVMLIRPDEPLTTGWLIWLLAFLPAAFFILSEVQKDSTRHILALFPLAAGAQSMVTLLMAGEATAPLSALIPVTIGIASGLLIKNHSSITVVAPTYAVTLLILGSLLGVLPPTTTETIIEERATAQSLRLPEGAASIGHTGTDAFAHFLDFEGAVYLLDGSRSPEIREKAMANEFAMAIIMTAPDLLFLGNMSDEVGLDSPGVEALNYEALAAQPDLLQRMATVSDFDSAQPTNITFGPDVTLTSVAMSNSFLSPDSVLRLRLHWQFQRQPEAYDMTLNISLIDQQGIPVITTFPVINAPLLETTDLKTYHAVHLPEDTIPGVYDVSVSVDYRAGLLGRQSVTQVVVPFLNVDIDNDVQLGDLGRVVLRDLAIYQDEAALEIALTWETQQLIDTAYAVFTHLTQESSPQPVRQADGPPVNGRYPTNFWRAGDVVIDNRTLDLTNLESGRYQINVGFYREDGSRMSGADGDALTIAEIDVQEDGTIRVSELDSTIDQ